MNATSPVPQRVLAAPCAGDGPVPAWPLHVAATTAAIEAVAAAALPPNTLMQRAGLAVARLALAVAPHACKVWIAAGCGNNGGDGLEAALHLAAAGKEVTIGLEPTERRPPDAQAALARAQAAGLAIHADPQPAALGAGDLAIDALFGLGLARAPEGWALAALRAMNGAPAPVLAIDLPSGLDGDTGRLHADEAAVRARWTLALLTLKPGLFTAAGRDHAGEVWFERLGVADERHPPAARLLDCAHALWPRRRHAQHKGSFGDVWVVGGAPGMAGASLLAARAALAAGAGRVFWVPLDAQLAAIDAIHPELMHRPPAALHAAGGALAQATVVCGCGGGEAVRPLLPLLLARAGRLLLDADALNALAADAALVPLLAARAARGRPTVLTPHPLEAARLLGAGGPAAVQADRLGTAHALAQRHQAVVVLKGSGSVIVAPGQVPWINASGNAALASAGTGDVLAGWIGGLWSQGMAPEDAARLGTWSHGAAADRWRAGRPVAGALEASELVQALREWRRA